MIKDLDNINDEDKKKIRDFHGVDSDKDIICEAQQEGVIIGKKYETQLKRSYKYYANQYNDLEKYFKDQEQKSEKPVDKINIDDNKINIDDNKINIEDIYIFNTTKKQDNPDGIDGRTLNDNDNGIRENIITAMINGNIPDYFYENSKQWLDLKNQIDKYINDLINKLYPNIVVLSKTIERKGGRKHKKDFILKLNKNDDYTISIEFKFNASNVSECPEFNSPCKPSKYFNIPFEGWYYDNYLNKIAEKGNLNMPNRETYIKQINNNKPECMTEYKTLYKTDSEFNDFCGRIDKEAISEFINNVVKLDTEKLSSYLVEGQKDKHYMMYKNGNIYYDKLDDNIFKLKSKYQGKPPCFICETEKNDIILEIRLRFKNGRGLLFPALQIKTKHVAVKNHI